MDYKKLLFYMGRPISPLYAWIMRLRVSLYKKNIFKSYGFAVPVISVGNLTMGGTGKTPTTFFLTEQLQKRGLKPAIISRGYGGAAKGQVQVVGDGKTILMDAQDAGDEPYMLANSLPGVVVITGSKRHLSIAHAIKHFNCDVIILDDGFQHLRVKRDIDLVLFGAETGFGFGGKYGGRVFPGGDLREARSALERADFFLITGVTDGGEQSRTRTITEEILKTEYGATPLYPVYRKQGVYKKLASGEVFEQEAIENKVAVFSGIANPERFLTDLEASGFTIASFTEFSDHQKYGDEQYRTINEAAKRSGAQAILTTEKDLVKFGAFTSSLPLYAVCPKTEIDSELIEAIYKKCLEKLGRN